MADPTVPPPRFPSTPPPSPAGTGGPIGLASGLVRLLLALVAVPAAVGCRAPRPAGFPVGLYAVTRPADLPLVREAGFDLVVGTASREYLDAARDAGVRVLATPGTAAGPGSFDAGAVRRTVGRFDRHPALAGWYLSDEPDLHDVAPEAIRFADRRVKAAGGRKPTALALFNGRNADDYAGLTDWLMIDRYPVPWLPLADFPKHLRLARHAAGRQRTLLAVIQAFDWSRYPEMLPRQSGLRPPDYRELRAMTYLALTQGANGVLYYCFDDGRWAIRDSPGTWDSLRRVVAEVRFFEALFAAPPVRHPLRVHYPARDRALNEALDPTVQAVVLRLPPGDALLESGDYLVTVNTTATRVVWQFAPSRAAPGALEVVNEGRWLTPADGWYTDAFAPYDVHVYGPLPARSRAR